jgi:hypothetical protein
MVCEVAPQRGKVVRKLPGGFGCRSPVLSHDGSVLYVCNNFGGDVWAYDVASGAVVAKMDGLREPFAAAITPDDSVLAVIDHLPSERSTNFRDVASKMLLFDAKAKKLRDVIPLPAGSHSALGLAISPDGNYAFATHLIAMFTLPAIKVAGGWVHTNNCAIVDIKKRRILNDVTLDMPHRGFANPWGIACSRDGKFLCVTHAGSGALSVIDAARLVKLAASRPYFPSGYDPATAERALSHDFGALLSVKDSVSVKERSPRALAIVGGNAYVAGYFGETVEIFKLGTPGAAASRPAGFIALGPPVASVCERRGEAAFCDGRFYREQWQSCGSCHPFARSDALNWILRGDFDNPRNAKSMAMSWWAPPASWTGIRSDAGKSVRAGLSSSPDPAYRDPMAAVSIDTFLLRLKPVPSPRLIKGRLSASALRGRDVFFGKAACGACHMRPLFSDKRLHENTFEDTWDPNSKWDTPSLIECWRSAPYGHNGSGLTVRDFLGASATCHSSGMLTEREIGDLVEFVLSL